MIWSWQSQGRSPRSILTLAATWAAILLIWAVLNVHWGIVMVLAIATLPLLSDIVTARQQQIEVHQARLVWSAGNRTSELALEPGTTVSLRRRFDGGLRIVVTDRFGAEIRLPAELNPPLAELELALDQTPAKVRRDPFRFV